MRSVDEVVEVAAPVGEVWARWADVERLPEFMEGIESVRREGEDHLEWKARLNGEVLTWTSRITRWEPEALIAWISDDGTEDVGGRVEFSEAGEAGRTRLHVVIDWPSADMVEMSLDRLRGLVEGSQGGERP